MPDDPTTTPAAPPTPPSVAGVQSWLDSAAAAANAGKTKDAVGLLWGALEEATRLLEATIARVQQLEHPGDGQFSG